MNEGAYEAQRLFFEIGMRQREVTGRALAALGLSFTLVHALRLIEPGQPVAMSELAQRLACDASNVTGIADRLEKRGLVERRASEKDRRVKLLALTPEGEALRATALETMIQPPEALLALSPAEQDELVAILRRARAAVETVAS